MAKLNWNKPDIKSIEAVFSWGNSEVDYAVDVAVGQFYLNGTRGIGRDWREIGLSRNDLLELVLKHYDGNIENIGEAFKKAMEDLGEDFKDIINNYDWGIIGKNMKQYRNTPTFQTITDSGALVNSQELTFNE